MTYKQYHNIISEWNNMLYDYSKNKDAGIYGVLKISTILTKPEDFTLGIEPSAEGGAKLVSEMLAYGFK